MAINGLNGVIRQLRKAAFLPDGGGMTDGQLLERFVTQRDETAFEALLRRHGPMVWGVCRRVLSNDQDAEDAFQAAFLVLVRKAASIRQRELVGNWLYGAAYRAALEARASGRRRSRERQVSAMPEPAVIEEPDVWQELRPVLDREISRLPDRYRLPVVLCDLEGRKRKEVARQLGLPEGTLSGRLTTARRMLARRLTRLRLSLVGGALGEALSQGAVSAAVPDAVIVSTLQAASLLAAGQAATGIVSGKAAALMEGVLKAMFLSKLKVVTAILLMAGTLGTVAGLFTCQVLAADQSKAAREAGPESLPTAGERPREDKEKLQGARQPAELQGAWRLTGAEWDGRNQLYALKPLGDWTWHFRGSVVDVEVEALEGNARRTGAFSVNAGRTPKEMDFTLGDAQAKEPRPAKHQAIYAVEGDTLQISYARDSDQARPTTFATRRGDGDAVVVLTLKRAAVEKHVPAAAPGKQGRLFLYRNGRFASFDPETKAEAWHSPVLGLTRQCKISPDGKWMVYGLDEYVDPVLDQQEEPEGDPLEKVYIRHLETKETIDLGLKGHEFCWSRDGRFLAVSRVDDFKTLKISNHLVEVGTRKITELTLPEGHVITDWSADGLWFLTTTVERDGKRIRNQVHLVKKDGQEVRALGKKGETAVLARLSPDGRRCAWQRCQEKDGRTEEWVEVLDIATSKRTRVSEELNGEFLGFCWSPDGQRLAYVWRQHIDFKTEEERLKFDGAVETFLIMVNADGSNPQTALSERVQGINAPAIVALAMPDWR